jgi:hypothetical protein
MMTQPGLSTLIAQASVGCIVASYVLILILILLVPHSRNDWLVFWIPPLFVLGPAIGTLAGLLIWTGGKIARRSLSATLRTVIGGWIVAVTCVVLALSLSWKPTIEAQLWLVASIIVPGLGIGLFTNSRLRVWPEFVRQGEAVRRAPRILAGLTGLVLRPIVVFFFMNSLIILLARLQSSNSDEAAWPWPALIFSHCAASLLVLFSRRKTSDLFLLALIANAPIAAALIQFRVSMPNLEYVALPYLGVWAMFLLTRWRQTDSAFSFLNEEIHYYLID